MKSAMSCAGRSPFQELLYLIKCAREAQRLKTHGNQAATRIPVTAVSAVTPFSPPKYRIMQPIALISTFLTLPKHLFSGKAVPLHPKTRNEYIFLRPMATYTITLNERTSSGKALMAYLEALGVLISKVTPKKKSSYLRSQEDKLAGRVEKFSSSEELFESLGI